MCRNTVNRITGAITGNFEVEHPVCAQGPGAGTPWEHSVTLRANIPFAILSTAGKNPIMLKHVLGILYYFEVNSIRFNQIN